VDEELRAAWLFAQHASHHPDLQRKFLGLLRDAVAAGEAPPRHLAYLEDRWEPHPIEDPEHVDERRAAVGLRPLAEYAATMNSRDD
jgi:hypothetical protein